MSGSVASYRDLLVWQKGMDLVVAAYELAKKFPPEERYGLVSQVQRAAVSIPANIAEGHGRRHRGDFIHHVSMARGSLLEVETHVLIAVRLGYLPSREAEHVLRLTDELGRMISGLIQKLRGKSPTS